MKLFNKVVIIGTGLIGGSMALAIKKKGESGTWKLPNGAANDAATYRKEAQALTDSLEGNPLKRLNQDLERLKRVEQTFHSGQSYLLFRGDLIEHIPIIVNL